MLYKYIIYYYKHINNYQNKSSSLKFTSLKKIQLFVLKKLQNMKFKLQILIKSPCGSFCGLVWVKLKLVR